MNDAHALTTITSAILDSYEKIGGINHLDGSNLPSRQGVHRILEQLKEILFPGYFEQVCLDSDNIAEVTEKKIGLIQKTLSEEIYKGFWCKKEQRQKDPTCWKRAQEITQAFLAAIPELRETLKEDANAIFLGDPAAKSEHEIILCYPGFLAITAYRMAHFLYELDVMLIPRIMAEIVHSQTGIDIHPGAKIGRRFCIDHGTGIVIGETAVIGDDVKLYQGVTLGALSVPDKYIVGKRHPTLKNNITVYAKTTILGGQTEIGNHCIIGGNVWLTHSIPDHSKIYLSEDLKQVLKEGEL